MNCPFQSFAAIVCTAFAALSGAVSAQTAIDDLIPQGNPAPVVTQTIPMRIAVLMPAKNSPFYPVMQASVNGILASNYATEKPAEILLIHPDSHDDIVKQAEKAAAAGAMAAVGPIERDKIERLSRETFLPLPVVALNHVDIDREIELTPEEIEAKKRANEAQALADQAQRELNEAQTPATAGRAAYDTTIDRQFQSSGSIAAATNIPGFVSAENLPEKNVRYEPRQFPRQFLMLGLSMEEDANYVAQLGIDALPRLTESGQRPRVLLIDSKTPLDQRISAAFEKKLRSLGFVPDRLTVDMDAYKWVNQFFRLVVDRRQLPVFDETPIDQEADPAGWRRQQMRIRRAEASMRARAALAEPPYQAIFVALDAQQASLVRSRLPLRSRLWATSAVNPGDTANDSQARALTFDLLQVGYVESPFVLHFDELAFEEKYKTRAPKTVIEKRFFALGADALYVAKSMAKGQMTNEYDGLTGHLSYDLDMSPAVTRRSETAMIEPGEIVPVTPEDLQKFQSVTFNKRLHRYEQESVRRAPDGDNAEQQDEELGQKADNSPTDQSEVITAPPAEEVPDMTTQALP